MNLKEIREILELLKGSDVPDSSSAAGNRAQTSQGAGDVPVALPPATHPLAAPARAVEESPPAAPVPPKPTYKEILSRSWGPSTVPAPDAAPFVEVGDPRGQGTGLCMRRGDEDHEPDRVGHHRHDRRDHR